MRHTTVLISGAGIAGPALAFWLARYGCTVTVVERAPAVRAGGQAVDFKGATHRTVLSRMGVLDELRRRQTGGRDQNIVDAGGRRLAVIPGEFTGGDLEISRGELSAVLVQRSADHCEYRFGDRITSLTDTPHGVAVTFHRAAPQTFDLVVGADGIHSDVRRLAFGPESDHVRYLGHYYALADLGVRVEGNSVMYNEPGRMVALGDSALFVFASPELRFDRDDVDAQRRILLEAYRGGRWRIPELLDRLAHAEDVYVDSISRVEVPRYAKRRVALLGDAAYGNTLSGFGSGLAIVGAYVLAGELMAADGDHRVAFARYETGFRDYAKIARKANAGPFLAPGSRLRMAMRNSMFRSPWLLRMLLKATDRFATDIDLRDYAPPTTRPTPDRR